MPITLTAFAGTQPRYAPRRLEAAIATVAEDTKLKDGTLRGFRGDTDVHTFGQPTETFVRTDSQWEGYDGDVTIVPSPTADNRVYIAGDGVPKVRDQHGTHPLALPAPVSAPTATVTGSPVAPLADVGYCFTWVTVRAEESQPSDLSPLVATDATAIVRVDTFPATPVGRGITHKRIYRSVVDSLGTTSLFFVAEIAENVASYDHDPVATPVNEEISTIFYGTPPDNLEGMVPLQNGMIAAWAGKELYFCEPYKPHAWPDAYKLFTDYPIVGLAAFGTNLAIMTEGTPYRAQGSTPDTMRMEQIEQDVPCVSRDSIVDMGYSAVYASTDGLISITAEGAAMVSTGIFDKEEWEKLRPDTFNAARFEGQYLYAHLSDAGQQLMGLMNLDPNLPFNTVLNRTVKAIWFDLTTGDTFALNDGGVVRRMNDPAAAVQAYDWTSKEFMTPAPTNYGALMVDADPESGAAGVQVRVMVYGDDVLRADVLATPDEAVRLPSGYRAKVWKVRIRSTMRVSRVRIAHTIDDIKGVP